MHIGSLTTAVASYLEARTRGGRWLLRIEDLDRPREVPGAAADMLRTLEHLGFEWDAAPVFQSRRVDAYLAAEAELRRQGRCYPCSCTRRTLIESESGSAYPGTCRSGAHGTPPLSLRFLIDDTACERFDDRLRGPRACPLGHLGDPIIRRRDGLFAYQLAVVVDDHDSGVNDVVRGADLLESTGWQLALGRALGFPRPGYCHLPLVTDADGRKLSKSSNAISLDPRRASHYLHQAFGLLRQQPPAELATASVRQIWQWAVTNWRLDALHEIDNLPLAEGLLPPA